MYNNTQKYIKYAQQKTFCAGYVLQSGDGSHDHGLVSYHMLEMGGGCYAKNVRGLDEVGLF